jgi:hypothetical protein
MHIIKPKLKDNMTDNVREKMVLLSKFTWIITKAYGIKMPFNNDKWNKEFAFQIDSGNLFEHASLNLLTVIHLLHQGREFIANGALENGAFSTVFSENFHKF